MSSFLRNRSFCVKINNQSSPIRKIEAGVPQGSVLGPLLYNLYTHDIPEPTDCSLSMFADDTAIITQNNDILTAASDLQRAVNEVVQWCSKWSITINQEKCVTKIFTLRRPADPPDIIINNERIVWNPKEASVRYLGVHLDRRLSWGAHINKKLNECYVRLSKLYPVVNKKSPLKLKCTLLIYKSILRPIFTYACSVWGASSKTQINKLQVLQNKVLRMAVHAPWFIRNSQIHEELEFPTIVQFIKKLSKKFFSELNECPGARHYSLGIKGIHTRLKRRLPQDIFLTDDEQ